ncbi:MAG: DUF2927 domain-containing protein [Alphaproteobacteria bacterium]|nr:DUF2927 domain-containing protein [Alphaproteobacteria bacterium]
MKDTRTSTRAAVRAPQWAFRWALAVCVSVPVSLSPAGAAEGGLTVDTLAAAFQEVVFKTESGPGSQGKPVVKWQGPIAASLEGAEAATYRKDIDALFKQLQLLTGLQFVVVAPGSPSNMTIRFMPTAEIRRIAQETRINCYGTFRGSSKDFSIRQADVYISTDTEQKTRHCIPEEIAQVLGLPNDTPLIPDSNFNDDNTTLTGLSLSDKILVRTLYDRRIRPGMSAAEARPVARQVIGEMLSKLEAGAAAAKPAPQR